ncbi:hypothetical protein [Herbaspirillum sp. SJZ099]|uniref:hypothetical protein n=1 Tax=Herbaspirillum sp. SJZ099 TaxID=2572916 RepID=UPI00119FAA9B|nr:hypothetical protein [Herbaspirillum sp. SJZ099]TWC67291.1 hypothetical protein FB597_104101 [Herbaspirillum sp. SJZ099]
MQRNNFPYPNGHIPGYHTNYPNSPAPAYPVVPAPYANPSVQDYAGPVARPVHRRVTPPDATFYGSSQYQRLSARFTPSSARSEQQNPFTPLAPLPPPSHYLQAPPTLLHNPFFVRSAAPDPLQFEYTTDEITLLRSAGFRHADRQRLGNCPDAQFRFVMRHATWLAEHRFTPSDMLGTARLAPAQRHFVAQKARSLRNMGFTPIDMNDLAIMSDSKREFILSHGMRLRATGFSPLQMMLLANRPNDERRYVVVYGVELHERGYNSVQIRQQAIRPELRPDLTPRQAHAVSSRAQQGTAYAPHRTARPAAIIGPPIQPTLPPPRRVSTSEMALRQRLVAPAVDGSSPRRGHVQLEEQPRRRTTPSANSLTSAEREGFLAIGLAPEALDRLARCSATVRTYVLAYGGNLLAGGMAFEEILTMAEQTSGADNTPATGTGQHPGAQQTHGGHDEELAQIFSRLSTEQINQDPWLADSGSVLPRSASPGPMENPVVAYPRNNAQLDGTQLTALEHAHTRWSSRHTPHVTRTSGEDFYRDTVPLALTQKMATADDHPNLRLLLAGLAYAEDNRHADTAPGHRERVKALTSYLTSTDDPDLLRNCDSAAAEGVTHCGDRVAYGLTRVEQTILQRKIEHGEMPPRKLFESIESVFLQPRVENMAAYLANARKARGNIPATRANFTPESFAEQLEQAAEANFTRTRGSARTTLFSSVRSMIFGTSTTNNDITIDNSASESLEMYAALAPVLIGEGIHLVESARRSTYGAMYSIDPLEKEYALKEIRRHVRNGSDDFLQEFEGNTAVETILRRRFQDDFRNMRSEREQLQDQADDALFDADAPPGTQETVREAMTALATMEKEWYREKLKVVLRQRHLLNNLPPLAPDLALD